jgi:hypothetical protein
MTDRAEGAAAMMGPEEEAMAGRRAQAQAAEGEKAAPVAEESKKEAVRAAPGGGRTGD